MFLVDKYYDSLNYITYNQNIINFILDSFDNYNKLVPNINSNQDFLNYIEKIEYDKFRYSNFQHLIFYGPQGCNKEYIIDRLLQKIYGKNNIELKDVEYTLLGYSNAKTKVTIKQSKYHIVIEPNSNGFDKYLIQEIIQDYAKSEILNILKQSKLFKIIIINKIDNLSYYAQASLRRTMEKFSNTCKFILISDQLSKIIEPLRSRCILVRIPLPTRCQILESLLYISYKENINVTFSKLNNILNNCENKINNAIWLLELHKYNINYENNWEDIIVDIVNLIMYKYNDKKKLYSNIKKIREKFYILFITNISTSIIIKKIMIKLLEKVNNIKTKYDIIYTTSIFENRLNQGTRHIIHIEAYVIRLIYLLNNL